MPRLVRTREGSPGLQIPTLGSLPGNGQGGIPLEKAVASFPQFFTREEGGERRVLSGYEFEDGIERFQQDSGLDVVEVDEAEYLAISARRGPHNALTLGLSPQQYQERLEQSRRVEAGERTREELLEEARRLDIPGRSSMSKDRLGQAVMDAESRASSASDNDDDDGEED